MSLKQIIIPRITHNKLYQQACSCVLKLFLMQCMILSWYWMTLSAAKWVTFLSYSW